MGDLKERIKNEMLVDYSSALENNFNTAKRLIGITKEGKVNLHIGKNKLSGKQLIMLYLIGKVYAKEAEISDVEYVTNKELIDELGLPEGTVWGLLSLLNKENKIRQVQKGAYRIPINLIERVVQEIVSKLDKEDNVPSPDSKYENLNKVSTKFTNKKRKVRSTSLIEPVPFDTKANGKKPSLIDFYQRKKPSSHQEKLVVYMYYITKYAGIKNVEMGHIAYAYKATKQRMPRIIYRIIINIKNRFNYVAYDSKSKCTLTNLGEEFVEYDLPRSENTSK